MQFLAASDASTLRPGRNAPGYGPPWLTFREGIAMGHGFRQAETGISCSARHFRRFFEDHMANTPQAKKRIRRNERRAAINGSRLSRIRTLVKKVEGAIAAGDKDGAVSALQAVQPELARGVARGVLHKNTASRKFGRLTKAVSALG